MSAGEARIALRFHGTVQRVGFRATSASIATALALKGWVRNEVDGTVSAEVQGDPADLARFLDELGSAMAGRISRFERRELPPAADLRSFHILRG